MSLPFLTPLFTADLRALNIPEPWAFGMADRVRFGELDVLNHVNNTAYLGWYETLRVAYLEEYGLYEAAGPAPKYVIKTASLDYKAEVKRGASYLNVARTAQIRRTSFSMEYATFVDSQITTTGAAVVVLLNQDNSKRALPDALRDTLISRDGAVQL